MTVEKSIAADHLLPLGAQVGDNWAPEGHHETRDAALGAVGHPRGTGDGDASQDDGDLDAGEPRLKVAEILERFAENTKLRLKDRVRADYSRAFRRFAEDVRFPDYSRRQIAGPTGRKLILAHLEGIPKPSRRWVIAALRAVWTSGTNLPWPVEVKRDLGRLPRTQRGRTPPDADVRPWAQAVRDEREPYLHLLGVFLLQYGWRPSQISHLRWRNVEYGEDGRPRAIVASGSKEDFKTDSDVRAWLPPDVVEAIEAWRQASPDTTAERPILPRRGITARLPIDPARMHDRHSFTRLVEHFEAKWRLRHLTPKPLRHFVATKCREAGMSYQASAFWQGHDPASSGAMRDWYDNPDDTFAEQSAKMPYGPLGLLDPPKVASDVGLPPEIVRLLTDYLNQKVGTMELATRLETLRVKTAVGVVSQP